MQDLQLLEINNKKRIIEKFSSLRLSKIISKKIESKN